MHYQNDMQQRARRILSAAAKRNQVLACGFLKLLQSDQRLKLIGLTSASVEQLLPIAELVLHF